MIRLSTLAGMCLALAACGGGNEAAEQADDDRNARGEVLGGSISDDMLPLDTIRSQSPPLEVNRSVEDDDSGAAPSADEPSTDEPENSDAPAPEVETEADEPETEAAE